jgi:hypothetical protein
MRSSILLLGLLSDIAHMGSESKLWRGVCSKPHMNIGTIGHVDHGKTTLTATSFVSCPPHPQCSPSVSKW